MIQIQKIHKRYASIVMSGMMVMALTMSGFAYNDKTVTVVADGSAHTVKTHLSSTRGIAQDAGVKLDPKDAVVVDTNTIQDGSTLTVVRAVPVTVTVNGKTKTMKTAAQTVQALADELGYSAPTYTTKQDGNAPVVANMTVEIVKVGKHEVKHTDRAIPVTEERQQDDSMAIGETAVTQEGTAGGETVREDTLYDTEGHVIKTSVTGTSVKTAMVPTIVKEGTRDVVTPSNAAGRAQQVLYMEASAYLPGDGDGRGITATGIPAVRGVVAVDPDVIPLGTRLYIPGYGEAVAADTGGAIVGNRIDLLMDSYGEAMNFGRQDVQVYVLGY